MFVSSAVEVLAFNTAGDAVLIVRTESGPEGGGSTTYAVFGPRDAVEAPISSDFSPGDGSTPEAIPNGDCRRAAQELRDAVAERGFTGVTVRPDKCDGDRSRVVEVDVAARAHPRTDEFADVKVVDRPGGVHLRGSEGELSVGGSEHGAVTLWRQGAGPLLIVQYTTLEPDSPKIALVTVAPTPALAVFPRKATATPSAP